jgi:N-glycosidase YbiA
MAMPENKDILFYTREGENGYLSNFARYKMVIDGKEYLTNEHYYQSMKAKDPLTREWIRNAPNAFLAMSAGRSLRPIEIIDNWNDKKADIMLKGIRAKFYQHKELAEELICTGEAAIHEDSLNDMYWGIRGKDVLGKLLMKVRHELKMVKLGLNPY